MELSQKCSFPQRLGEVCALPTFRASELELVDTGLPYGIAFDGVALRGPDTFFFALYYIDDELFAELGPEPREQLRALFSANGIDTRTEPPPLLHVYLLASLEEREAALVRDAIDAPEPPMWWDTVRASLPDFFERRREAVAVLPSALTELP